MNTANVVAHSARRAVYRAYSARQATVSPVRVRFDAFDLDEANALLLRDGHAVALAPRPFSLLCALARQPGSLITKDTLLDDVWGHQFYSDSVLKTAVSEVRTVLDDDPRAPRFIETVSRRGYRFIGATTAIPDVGADTGDRFLRPAVDRQSGEARARRRRVNLLALSASRLRHDRRSALCRGTQAAAADEVSGLKLEGAIMSLMPRTCPECGAAGGEPHVQSCSFDRRYEAVGSPLIEWLASLPAAYDRLKARDRDGPDEAGPFVAR